MSQSNRERLLILLAELKSHKGMERAEQFNWFIENSNSGENCGYAKKALSSFYQKHYDEISSLIHDIMVLIREVDNAERQH